MHLQTKQAGFDFRLTPEKLLQLTLDTTRILGTTTRAGEHSNTLEGLSLAPPKADREADEAIKSSQKPQNWHLQPNPKWNFQNLVSQTKKTPTSQTTVIEPR